MKWRELFYLRKSDRQVVLALLGVIVVALGIIFLTGGDTQTDMPVPADTTRTDTARKGWRHDSAPRYRERVKTVYVRTKVVYRDTAFSRGHALTGHGQEHDATVYQPKIHQGEHIVLNTADTTALKTVPGIGPYFARKIVQYGERLGGYVSTDQLEEIEDFPLDAKQYLTVENAQPRRLNLNRLSLSELRRHPYINFYMARAITDYRRLHGPIRSLDDLSLSKDFPPEVIARLQPYVEF